MSKTNTSETVEKEGLLKKKFDEKTWNKWRKCWFILKGGSLFYYRKMLDYTPEDVVNLNVCLLHDTNPKCPYKNGFTIAGPDKEWHLVASTPTEKAEWMKLIKINMDAQALPSSPPEKDFVMKKKMGMKQTFETAIVGKAASTSIGRKILREFVFVDTLSVLDLFLAFVEHFEGPKKAKEFENGILTLAVKVAIPFKHGQFTKEHVTVCRAPVVKVCRAIIDYYQMPSIFDPEMLKLAYTELEQVLQGILFPVLSEKSRKKLTILFDYVRSEAVCNELFEKRGWKGMNTVVQILTKHFKITAGMKKVY